MSTKPITNTITAPILDIVEARDCIATLNQILEDVTNLIWLIQQDTRPVQITEKSLLRAIGGYTNHYDDYAYTISEQLNELLTGTKWHKNKHSF